MESAEKAIVQYLAETEGLDPGSPEVQAKRQAVGEKVQLLDVYLNPRVNVGDISGQE